MSRYSADSLPETNRAPSFRLPAHASHLLKTVHILPNVKDEPRPWLARLVLLGARGVTAMVVGSGAWLGRFSFAEQPPESNQKYRNCTPAHKSGQEALKISGEDRRLLRTALQNRQPEN